MKKLVIASLLFSSCITADRRSADWLLEGSGLRATLIESEKELVLDNGLIRRRLRISPNAATVGFDNLMTGAAILRGVKPEALVDLDGTRYGVGGLDGQPEYAYLLPEWIEAMTSPPGSFRYTGHATGPIRERFPWKRVRHAEDLPWPPAGIRLDLAFEAPPGPHSGVAIGVHYELYDGLPLLTKWITLENGSGKPVELRSFTSELLAVVEPASDVEVPHRWELPNMHVETDYAFGGFTPASCIQTAHWEPDPQYSSQVNYRRTTPNLLAVRPPLGPELILEPGARFESFRTWELVHDSTERERRGLAQRRMYRTIAPWVTENPILMHVRSAEPDAVRLAVDQCAELGFEMVIMTFGSGFNFESTDPEYQARIKNLVDYAHERGVELGGYSLLSSRKIGPEHDVIDPETGEPGGAKFGNAPCLESSWGIAYFEQLATFIERTGLDLLEHDGSYPGDVCASTEHPGHRSLGDSQWMQRQRIVDFYKWCRARGVYLNVPDWYFLNGSNKCGMGYRETNWSLPREQQIILGRQNIFDGTWFKTPSMGWMFVPLVEYHGGGAAATLEPLAEHLDAYEAHLANNFAAGVQACYRGPRLYDSPETKVVVEKWVRFYREHRAILDSDLIHLRRADGVRLDALLHVNPRLEERGMLVVFNPTDADVATRLDVPLYYTGLKTRARVRHEDGDAEVLPLDREHEIDLAVRVPAQGVTWYVIEAP